MHDAKVLIFAVLIVEKLTFPLVNHSLQLTFYTTIDSLKLFLF